MSAIDDANRRLEAALSRLEVTLQAHLTTQDSGADAERARLEQEMAAVRANFADLQETSTVVSQRLDTAIGQLKGMLAE